MRFHKEIKMKLYRRNAERLCKLTCILGYLHWVSGRAPTAQCETSCSVCSFPSSSGRGPSSATSCSANSRKCSKTTETELSVTQCFSQILYNYWERSKSWWWHWGHQLQGISRKDTNNLKTCTQWWTCTSITKFTMKMYYVSKLAWEEQH